MEKYTCHDCKKELKEGDEYMSYESNNEETFRKCRECHEKDPVLRDFQETEVYSRIVGYIRPVKQWNPGKEEEYNERKEFKI